MELENLNKNNIENNERQGVFQGEVEQKEIDQEELLGWLDQEEETFKKETRNELSKSNSVGLDEQTFEQIKIETNINNDLNNIDSEMDEIVLQKTKEIIQKDVDEEYMQHDIDAFLNSSEVDENKIQRDFLKNFQTTMKVEEFKKVTPYIRSEHQTINGLLRQGKEVNIENVLQYKGKELSDINKEWNADVVESFYALEDCIEKSQFTVPEEGVGKKVYRVINGDHLADFNQGDTITEKSFLSTSLDESYKDHYLNDADEETILTIKFPDNSKVNGICIGNVENEFLLPRNMSYRILDKKLSIINGVKKFEIEAEFLPNKHIHIQK